MSKALIIIDIQNDYFKGGALELHNPEKASENAKQILEKFRKDDLPIIHVEHITADPQNMPFFIEGTEGQKIHESVQPKNGEKVIQKSFPNAFLQTDLLDYLKTKDIKEVVVLGMMTSTCVDSTVRAAKDHGFDCTVIGDACATRDLEVNGNEVKADDVHNSFLAGLSFFYADIQTTQNYLSS